MHHKILFLAGLMLISSHSFAEDCVIPASPSIPDGRSAQMDEMVETMKAVKGFVSKSQSFRACVNAKITAAGENIDPDYKIALGTTLQESLETEQLVADTFNAQLRIFKATH